VIRARRARSQPVVHFSGDEQEVRDAATEVVAAWDEYMLQPYYRYPPPSVAAEVAELRAALDADTATLAGAVSRYLAGVAYWTDEALKLAELRLRRAAYPMPDRAALRRCRPLSNPPLRTPRRPMPPHVSVMPFRPGQPPID